MALKRTPTDVERRHDPNAVLVYPMTSRPILSLYSQMLALSNPWVEDPAPHSVLAADPATVQKHYVGDPLLQAAEAAATIALSPQFWKFDVLSNLQGATAPGLSSVPASIMMAAKTAAGMHQHIHHPRIRLMDDPRIKAALAILQSDTPDTWTLEDLAKGLGVGGLADATVRPQVAAFMSLLLTATYRKVMASGYYRTAPADAKEKEDPASLAVRSTAEKTIRMAIHVMWVGSRPFDAALRPFLHYLTHPTNRTYLERAHDPAKIALFAQRCQDILKRPTDPWHAQALRFFAPANRPGPYGQSPSMGLAAHILGDPQIDGAELSAILTMPKSLSDALSLRALFVLLKPVVDHYWMQLQDWHSMGGLEPLESAIGATQVGSPLTVWLWGEDMPIIHGDGLSLTSLPRDPLELMTSLALPAAVPKEGSSATPFRYTAAMPQPFYVWGKRSDMVQNHLDKQLTLSFEPVDPDLMLGPDILGLIPPQSIVWVNKAYVGEVDATFITPSLEALAEFMGVDAPRFKEMVMTDSVGWSHIFDVDQTANTVEVKKGETGLLYYSSRTRRLYLRDIKVPNLAPPWCGVVKRGSGVAVVPVAHTLYLTKSPPVPMVSAETSTAKLLATAMEPLK